MDVLVARGVRCLTVLDIAAPALKRAQARLGETAKEVRWVEGDVTDPLLQLQPVDIWHDRAVFHFLTDRDDRHRYVALLRATLKEGGNAVFGAFALDGPTKCSGLPVMRYSAETLNDELGSGFSLARSVREEHRTPSGNAQAFEWCRFVRR